MGKWIKSYSNKMYKRNLKYLLLLLFTLIVAVYGVLTLYELNKIDKLGKAGINRTIKKDNVVEYIHEKQNELHGLAESISALKKEAFDQLDIIRKSKKHQMERYFKNCFSVMEDMKNNLRVKHGLNAFSIAFKKGIDSEEYKRTYKTHYEGLRTLKEILGFYDIFIIDLDGNIVFTEKRESDLGLNLNTHALKNTGLAKAFLKGQKEITFIDFSWYPASKRPAAFFAGPIKDNQNLIKGVIALQLDPQKINSIMDERLSDDISNEAYLVGQDYLLRSDSLLEKNTRSVINSFRFPEDFKIQTKASMSVINGNVGQGIIKDYRKQFVLSVWTPLSIGNSNWGIIVETDVADVFSPTTIPAENFFYKYKKIYRYYDIFLIDSDGFCFYTAEKEDDYHTNFLTGKYKDTNLGNLIRRMKNTKKFELVDFFPYAPSSNRLAAFIGMPILKDNQIELIVAVQITPEAINHSIDKGQQSNGSIIDSPSEQFDSSLHLNEIENSTPKRRDITKKLLLIALLLLSIINGIILIKLINRSKKEMSESNGASKKK